MSLKGKTILITGAAGGLGAALAMRCAQMDAELILLDKNRRGLGALSDRIVESGSGVPGLYPLDLAGVGIDDFNDLAVTLSEQFGGLDALVHCALDFDGLQPMEQIEPQQWLKSMQVNINAPWLLTCTCLPLLKHSASSHLYFLLDDADKISTAYWGVYGTAKAALANMVKQFADELEGSSVQVHGILPGAMRTTFRTKVYHSENPMEQPDPDIAAAKITAMLAEQNTGNALMVDLSS